MCWSGCEYQSSRGWTIGINYTVELWRNFPPRDLGPAVRVVIQRSSCRFTNLYLRSHWVLYTVIAMVFTAPSWVPQLPFDPPDSIPISEFMLNEEYGRHPLHHARPPFTCGLTGAEYSALEVRDRVEKLTKALSKELGWHPNKGTEWDKVIGVFSLNTVRFSIAFLMGYLTGASID